MPAIYCSFLVRLWRNTDPDAADSHWHGEIEHIQSGMCSISMSLDDALQRLRAMAEADTGTPLPVDRSPDSQT